MAAWGAPEGAGHYPAPGQGSQAANILWLVTMHAHPGKGAPAVTRLHAALDVTGWSLAVQAWAAHQAHAHAPVCAGAHVVLWAVDGLAGVVLEPGLLGSPKGAAAHAASSKRLPRAVMWGQHDEADGWLSGALPIILPCCTDGLTVCLAAKL